MRRTNLNHREEVKSGQYPLQIIGKTYKHQKYARFMTIINVEDLSKIREKYKNKKIVFCSGSFDLTHAGHVLFFEDCKKYGEILIVSVGKDSSIKKNKGEGRPIFNEYIRLKMIDSLKPVDYVYINPISVPGNKLYSIEHALENLKPDVYVINEDAFDIPYRKELCAKFNVKLTILPRYCPEEFEGISTSKIIEKIKNLKENSVKQNKKAIFLDRDGVIIDATKDFIFKKEDVYFLDGVSEALQNLKEKGFLLIIVTNQPAIARGLTTEDEVKGVHKFINEKLGNAIDKFYFCPHHPEMHPDVPEHAKKYRIKCNCRKPMPGMILQAAEDFHINLKESWMIGDMISDIITGKNSGCKTIMLESPKNEQIIKGMKFNENEKPLFFAKNLLTAIEFIN